MDVKVKEEVRSFNNTGSTWTRFGVCDTPSAFLFLGFVTSQIRWGVAEGGKVCRYKHSLALCSLLWSRNKTLKICFDLHPFT